MSFAGAMLVAMALDLAFGWPNALFLRIGHPVTWLGRLIGGLEAGLNRAPLRRVKGVLTALLVTGVAGGLAAALVWMAPGGWAGTVIAGILAWPLVAIRSMHDHVAAVARPLAAGDLPRARHAVSMIVGRDPRQLDQAGVARAAIESLAENTSDGIVAPLVWGVALGLPGIAAYKATDRFAQAEVDYITAIGGITILAGIVLYYTSRGQRQSSSLEFLIPDKEDGN